jgi:hypothetical protein
MKHTARELRKLRTLRIREKLLGLRKKATALTRLASGSFKVALWHAMSKSSTGIAEREARGFLSVADINLLAAKAYDPGTYAGRILFFLTKDDPTSLYAIDPVGRWTDLAEGGIEVFVFGGGHTPPIRQAPNIDLAEKLKSCLAEAQTLKESAAKR